MIREQENIYSSLARKEKIVHIYYMSLQMYEKKKVFVLGVAAGKGGVGKSTITVNLARAFQRMGLKVGVLDADIYGPSLRRLLPEEKMPKKRGEWIEPALCSGIKLISMAYFKDEGDASAVRAPIVNGVIKQFIHQVDWGDLDVLMVDFPPGTGDVQLTLSQEAKLSGVVMVTTPQELALMDVRKAINMLEQVSVPVIGVIENMSYLLQGNQKVPLFGFGGGARLASECRIPFLGEIPVESEISHCGDKGSSLFESSAVDVQKVFIRIAGHIHGLFDGSQEGLGYGFVQIDPYTFGLTRPDGVEMTFRLSDLQKRCPCAGCVGGKVVDDKVKATHVQQVGHYGLKIQFTSGCSNGIYRFESLFQS